MEYWLGFALCCCFEQPLKCCWLMKSKLFQLYGNAFQLLSKVSHTYSSAGVLALYSYPLQSTIVPPQSKKPWRLSGGKHRDLGIGLIQENYHFTSWWEPNLPLNVEQLSNRFSKSSPTQDLSSQNSRATIMCWFSLSLSAESGATRKWREARSWLVKTRQHWASSGSLLSSMLSSMTRWSPTPPSSSSFASPGHEQGGEPAVQRAGGAQFQSRPCWSPLGPGWLPPSLSSGHVHCTVCQVFKSLLLSSGNIWLWWLLSPFCTDINV